MYERTYEFESRPGHTNPQVSSDGSRAALRPRYATPDISFGSSHESASTSSSPPTSSCSPTDYLKQLRPRRDGCRRQRHRKRLGELVTVAAPSASRARIARRVELDNAVNGDRPDAVPPADHRLPR